MQLRKLTIMKATGKIVSVKLFSKLSYFKTILLKQL